MICIVLAAGTSSRMNASKLLLEIDGQSMIGRVLAATQSWRTTIVTGPSVAEAVRATEKLAVIVNREPERGMAHSLRLALAGMEAHEAACIVLGDKPFLTPSLIERIVRLHTEEDDITFPVHHNVGGHPVILSPRALEAAKALPDGDTIHMLKVVPGLRMNPIECDDVGYYTDIDTPEDLTTALQR